MKPIQLFLILLAALALAACGDDSGSEEAASGSGSEAAEQAEGSAGESGSFGEEPAIEVPDEPPPDQLVVDDLIEGEGDAAQPGDTLVVEYKGVTYDDGEEFDSSYSRPEPFEFQLGAGMVIPGWDEGLVGLKEGGRRRLVIPPDLAYGEQGAPPAIGPNETLVFVIDLVEIAG